MKLADYLYWKGITKEDFAQEIHASRQLISRIALGLCKPHRSIAMLIEMQTNGMVTEAELLNPKLSENVFEKFEAIEAQNKKKKK